MPSRVPGSWRRIKEQLLFRTSLSGLEAIATKQQVRTRQSSRVACQKGCAHALERLRWDRLGVPVLFCTGVGVAKNRQEVRALRLSRPRGSLLPFRRRIPASCPFLENRRGLFKNSPT